MAEKRKRRADAEIVFKGQAVGPDMLKGLWTSDYSHWQFTRERMAIARGLRLKTTTVQLSTKWVRRHPEAADWVVKVLPERRTLERDLIASVGAVEPTYSRVAIGDLDRDADNAEALENYMETWRQEAVPYQTSAEKCAEDGPHGAAILPSDVDMEGCPDFYDRLSEAAYAALDAEQQAEYTLDEGDPKGRYAKLDDQGNKKAAYDSEDAHRKAVQRYLLNQEQGAVSIRLIPASDCIPYLTRGTKRERWKLFAMLERTLYYPEELMEKGYGWRGMGDRALIPRGYEASRDSGQNGMFYLYTLYRVWVDPKDPDKIERPLICYSVGGWPTWTEDPGEDEKLPDNGIVILDLYESHGLTGPFWWFGGGLHTSDDDPDFYWEPYLWPLAETILGIEGMQTMANAATAVNATPGYFHKPDAAILGLDNVDAEEALLDSKTGALVVPEMPDSDEIKTVYGDVIPANPATVSPDLWRVIQLELASLRDNTALEQPGSASQASGHSMVVKESIGLTAKRHIREGSCDFVKFCGERALRILTACAREFDVRWPIQATKDRPVGAEMRQAGDVLEFDPDWVGDGEYRLNTDYPAEPNPVQQQQEMSKIQLGVGSFEALCAASGITDVESEWARVLKTQMRMSDQYKEMMMTRYAKKSGNALMLQVLKLQKQQRMTQAGAPGFEQGMPTAALNGPGQQSGGGIPGQGPTAVQSSLGGQMAAATGPSMQDAQAVASLQGAA